MRKQFIENEELKSLLLEKDSHIQLARGYSQQIDELQAKIEELEEMRNKEGLLVQQIKDKVFPIMDKVPVEKTEFEYEGRLVVEDGQVVLEINDALEEWKEHYLKSVYGKKASGVSSDTENAQASVSGEAVTDGSVETGRTADTATDTINAEGEATEITV